MPRPPLYDNRPKCYYKIKPFSPNENGTESMGIALTNRLEWAAWPGNFAKPLGIYAFERKNDYLIYFWKGELFKWHDILPAILAELDKFLGCEMIPFEETESRNPAL